MTAKGTTKRSSKFSCSGVSVRVCVCVRNIDRFTHRYLLVTLTCCKHSLKHTFVLRQHNATQVFTLNPNFDVLRKCPHNAGVQLDFVHTTAKSGARLCTTIITKEEVLSVWGPEGEEKDEEGNSPSS